MAGPGLLTRILTKTGGALVGGAGGELLAGTLINPNLSTADKAGIAASHLFGGSAFGGSVGNQIAYERERQKGLDDNMPQGPSDRFLSNSDMSQMMFGGQSVTSDRGGALGGNRVVISRLDTMIILLDQMRFALKEFTMEAASRSGGSENLKQLLEEAIDSREKQRQQDGDSLLEDALEMGGAAAAAGAVGGAARGAGRGAGRGATRINPAIRGLGRAGSRLPLIGGLIAGGMEYFESGDAGKSLAVGGGSMAGAAAGAAAGSFLGPLGTIAGGIGGGILGSMGGGGIFDMFRGRQPRSLLDGNFVGEDGAVNINGDLIFKADNIKFEGMISGLGGVPSDPGNRPSGGTGNPMHVGGTTPATPTTGGSSSTEMAIDGGGIHYANQNALRNLPITDELRRQLSYASEKTGLQVEIFSGGQAHGKSRGVVGSERHNDGRSADVRFFTINERGEKVYIDAAGDDPRIREFAIAAFHAGATGIGVGEGYMNQGNGIHGMHIGGGNPAHWGAGGRSSRSIEWLAEARRVGEDLRRRNPINLTERRTTENLNFDEGEARRAHNRSELAAQSEIDAIRNNQQSRPIVVPQNPQPRQTPAPQNNNMAPVRRVPAPDPLGSWLKRHLFGHRSYSGPRPTSYGV